MVTFTTDLDRIDLDVVHGWMAGTYWATGRTREQTSTAAQHSLNAGAIDDDGATVGYARLVTDRVSFAWLSDVFVAPEARGRGIARDLVRALLAEAEPWGLRRILLTTRDAQAVYAPLGFGAVEDTGSFLQIPAGGPADAGSS